MVICDLASLGLLLILAMSFYNNYYLHKSSLSRKLSSFCLIAPAFLENISSTWSSFISNSYSSKKFLMVNSRSNLSLSSADSSFYSSSCWFTWAWIIISSQAAEQAKASPALVAKDPSTSTNKKEEEDLAKGKEAFSLLSCQRQNLFEEALSLKHAY